MLNEPARRRPGFRDGPRIVLGDGQEWTFPRPWLRLYPARAVAGGPLSAQGKPSYGTDYLALVDQLVDCDPADIPARLALQFQMAACLLERNYELDDHDLARLLAIDVADPDCEARWLQINQVLMGRPPKPSADGSATP